MFGEVGLSGEIRAVAQSEARLKEAAKIGFRRAVIPAGNSEKIKGVEGIEITGIRDIEGLLKAVLR
jgi:DNA repair protein RadA/Sms